MEEISDVIPLSIRVYAAVIWFTFIGLIILATDIYWGIPLAVLGAYIFIVYLITVKKVCVDFDSRVLRVEHNKEFINLGFEEILSVEPTTMLKGCYKVETATPSKMGKYFLVTPKCGKFLNLHPSFVRFKNEVEIRYR